MCRCRSSLMVGVLLAIFASLWYAVPQPPGGVAMGGDPAKETTPAKPSSAIVPLYSKTSPAKNTTELVLHDDGVKVVGWLSGTSPAKGAVTVLDPKDAELATIPLDANNTFTWKYTFDKPTVVTVRATWALDKQKPEQREKTLTLSTVKEDKQPSVFFVVDRTAYRSGQSLHFAGFLRRLTAAGDFEPVAGEQVDVHLISESKKTRVAQLKLTSDDHGKITGSYLFSEADPLDTYALSVVKFKGEARILLGDYRKSKIKLKIDGELKDNNSKMKLTFAALDFLDKAVPASKASFTAQVVQDMRRKTATSLKPEDFVYHTSVPSLFGQIDELPEDEALLLKVHDLGSMQWFPSGGTRNVAQLSGDLTMNGSSPGEHTLDVKKEWLEGGYAILVQGVIVDANGREQRASKTIPLGELVCPGVKLELARTTFTTGEKITVTATRKSKEEAKDHAYDGPLTLVVMRLSPGTSQGGANYYDDYGYGYRSYNAYGRYGRYRRWNAMPAEESVKRNMVTAIPFGKGDAAGLRITEPGAYKLVAVGQREDGATVRTEVGCVVQAAEDLPAMTLKLDNQEITAGDKLTGAIHSKWRNARVLLTVRDSSGLRFWKALQLRDGVCALNEELPTGLRYGCSVEVEYPEADGQVATTHQFHRIVPKDRMLDIQTKLKDIVGPGETVRVEVDVNRAEEVDLIVSVYDQSLLAINPDRSVDIRNFYLADDRVKHQAARDLLRRRLGGVTLEQLVKKAEARLKAEPKFLETPEGVQLKQALDHLRSNFLYHNDLTALFRLVGVDAIPGPFTGYWSARTPDHKAAVASLLDQTENNGWTVTASLVNDTLMLHEYHPQQSQQMLLSQMSQLQGFSGGYGPGGRGGARGDAHFSRISGNSSQSFAPEGQAVMSHLPGGPPIQLIDADADQGHIFVRRDFSDSAFWTAGVRTDKSGKATVEFKVPDSLTNWQVVVTGVSKKMHVGQAKASFRTFKPIMIWPMLPRVFTEGDRVELFGAVHNRSPHAQSIKVRLKVENGEILSPEEKTVNVDPQSSVNVYWTYRTRLPGFTQLLMTADCPAGSDASLKRLPVYRAAAEQIVTSSGQVKKDGVLKVPEEVDLDSARLEISFAPSLAADLADTLNYLVDYPYGCVEQTMSRFLPAIKVAQILKQYQVEHPELHKKLPGCVAGGIKRLLELQQPNGGWGWHGNGNTHEMMTPYALYGLLQAEKAGYVIPNETAIERGLGILHGFIQNMGSDKAADRIYCIYVYSHRRAPEQAWWDWLVAEQKKGKLSDYANALALEVCVQHGKKDLAARFVKDLHAKAQKSAGGHVYWTTAGFSRWMEDRFEITAAVMKALVANDKDDPLIDGILLFFAATKRGDRWNSTKDTAMILFAMCDYLAKMEYDPSAKAELTFQVNDQKEQQLRFDDQLTKKVVLPGSVLKHGDNALSFRTKRSGVMYRLVLRYWKTGDNIPPMEKGIKVERTLYLVDEKTKELKPLKSGDSVKRGSYLVSEVTATNTLGQNMAYLLMENPKPGTAEILPLDDPRFGALQPNTGYALREERSASVAFHHEAAAQTITNRCVLLAELAGDYVVAPAWVELMYQTETRGHSGSFHLKVAE
jgi:Alpha-2-macroglobulin family/Bacterial Alpha-2-macroglobulin MG10 domain/A-macroglobulin TED domain